MRPIGSMTDIHVDISLSRQSRNRHVAEKLERHFTMFADGMPERPNDRKPDQIADA